MILYWLGLSYEQSYMLKAKSARKHGEAKALFDQARKKFEEARNAAIDEARASASALRPDDPGRSGTSPCRFRNRTRRDAFCGS
jgi:transposase-like protein